MTSPSIRNTKIVGHFLRIKRAKDSNGHEVAPHILVSQPGAPGDVPYYIDAPNEFDYNIDTGDIYCDQPSIETFDKEAQ